MDTQQLIQNLREVAPDELDWKLILYNTVKGRDGQELEFNQCKMQGISAWVESLKTAVLEKGIADRTVTEYSPFLPKEVIGVLEKENELIREQLGDILTSLDGTLTYAPEDFMSGVLPNPKGYGFYGYSKDENGKIVNQVLFLRRSNPFMAAGKTLLCSTQADEIVKSDKPMLKFTPAADFLFINDVCYFLTASIEKDFGLENRHIAITAKRLGTIADAALINEYDQFEKTAMAAKNAKKFIDFDVQILEHIAKLSVENRADFLSEFGIILDNEGKMDTRDPEQCELIIDLLCCRSCKDAFGRLSTGSKITPRE